MALIKTHVKDMGGNTPDKENNNKKDNANNPNGENKK